MAVVLYLTYPAIRGAPWLTWSQRYLSAAAALQLAALGAWAARKASERAVVLATPGATVRAWLAGVTLPERVGLVFAAGGAWDAAGALAPWREMVSAWGITWVGNWAGCAALCAVQAWAIWSTRKGRV